MKKGMNLQASPEMMAKATEGLSLSQADVKEIEQVKDQQDNLNKNKNDNQLLSLRKRLDVLLRTGQLLLESSADTNRIRRNMVRAALFLGFDEDNLHLFIDHNI